MSCGCAVVASNTGSLAEVAGEGAQMFAPMDADGMAQALARLLRRPDELGDWRLRALRRAAGFSWDQAALQTISVYHRTRQGVLRSKSVGEAKSH
jgi:glycosyltransferase involved in cell wall biosynthesis